MRDEENEHRVESMTSVPTYRHSRSLVDNLLAR
jgi:hypothetical protein